jgi:hypothetical protein
MEAQPATATGRRAVHVSNATVRMAREITKEHDKALKTLHLALGRPGTYGSPYLPLRWPEHRGHRKCSWLTESIAPAVETADCSPGDDLDMVGVGGRASWSTQFIRAALARGAVTCGI